MTTISVRLNDTELQLLDEAAQTAGCTRSELFRTALVSHRALTGARQRALDALAADLIDGFGEGALLTVRVTDSFDAQACIGGRPVDVYALAVADAGDTIQLIVGDRKSDARARIGVVPMRAGAEASIPLAMLPTVGIVDLHDE